MNVGTHELPALFGQYYLYDLIGKGGMAEIFLSKTFTGLGTERLCVIKRILPALNADTNFCDMLIQEAKLCAHLSHANVVQTYELGKISGQYYISMEYVEGVDLNQLLGLLSRSRISMPLPFALYVIVETLRGLDYAHRLVDAKGVPLGIIHRDVSPTNVLISTEGEVKICDFGIAKVALEQFGKQCRIDEYHLKGKVAYMAPEHVAGTEIDKRADLFAVGILLWELLSGRRLYKTKDDKETLRRALNAEVPPLVDRDFPMFNRLNAIVHKALQANPRDRYQTGQDFIRDVEDYLHATSNLISQLRFADFLMENFGENLMQQRKERERHLQALIEQHRAVQAGELSSVHPLTDYELHLSRRIRPEDTGEVTAHEDAEDAKVAEEDDDRDALPSPITLTLLADEDAKDVNEVIADPASIDQAQAAVSAEPPVQKPSTQPSHSKTLKISSTNAEKSTHAGLLVASIAFMLVAVAAALYLLGILPKI